ncbi:MAG: cytochrome c3 family protein [Planctomycetota bacterium]
MTPLLAILLVAGAAAGGSLAMRKPPAPSDTADINHAIHVGRDIECEVCHEGVTERDRAGIPSITVCIDCHEDDDAEALGGTPNAALIASHLESGEELWWTIHYVLPGHVVFSHRRHVAWGEIPCAACHGAIAKSTSVPARPVTRALEMKGCIACHETSGVSNDCWTCHR